MPPAKTQAKHRFARIHPKHMKRLRELCDELGQTEVGKRVGLTRSAISRLMTTSDVGVRPATLARIGTFCEAHPAPNNNGHPPAGADVLTDGLPLIEAFARIPAARRAQVLEALLKFI